MSKNKFYKIKLKDENGNWQDSDLLFDEYDKDMLVAYYESIDCEYRVTEIE